jgi:hypothetical protein
MGGPRQTNTSEIMAAPVTVDDALRGRNIGWFADKGIIKINAILALTLISSYANG